MRIQFCAQVVGLVVHCAIDHTDYPQTIGFGQLAHD
jgi:hypothetical protein